LQFAPHEKIGLVILRIQLPASALLLALFLAPLPAFGNAENKAAEEAGALLFRDKGCAHCHGAAGEGSKKAPSLIGIGKDKAWPPARMTGQILNGGQKMPPFSDSLTDAEAAQLVAYLRAKHKPTPPPAPAAPADAAAR
jgi:mono/diheme cytochrome c family protein